MFNIFSKIKLNKKLILPLLIISVLLFIALLMRSFLQPKKNTQTMIQNPTISLPVIKRESKWFYPIEAQINQNIFQNFPQQLPLLESSPSKPFSENEIYKMASNLNFSKSPMKTKDIIKGSIYLWVEDGKFLSVYTDINQLDLTYNTSDSIEGIRLKENSLIQNAENFLINHSLFTKDQLYFSFISYHQKDPHDPQGIKVSNPESANLYMINFSPAKLDYKLLNTTRTSPISVWILPNGTVSKVIISELNDLTFSTKKYQILDYSNFLNSLQNAVLVSLDSGLILPQDLSPGSISKIIVNQIEIAYLKAAETETVIQPVFLLSGEAFMKKDNQTVNVSLYLPAIKS